MLDNPYSVFNGCLANGYLAAKDTYRYLDFRISKVPQPQTENLHIFSFLNNLAEKKHFFKSVLIQFTFLKTLSESSLSED